MPSDTGIHEMRATSRCAFQVVFVLLGLAALVIPVGGQCRGGDVGGGALSIESLDQFQLVSDSVRVVPGLLSAWPEATRFIEGPGSDPPLIQIRLAEYERPSESAERAHFNGQDVFLHPEVVVSDKDVHAAEAAWEGEAVVLDVQLDPEGTERLRKTTAENIGRPMALLFEGRIVSIPVIRDELSLGRMRMAIPVDSEEQGEAVIQRVRARWPNE